MVLLRADFNLIYSIFNLLPARKHCHIEFQVCYVFLWLAVEVLHGFIAFGLRFDRVAIRAAPRRPSEGSSKGSPRGTDLVSPLTTSCPL